MPPNHRGHLPEGEGSRASVCGSLHGSTEGGLGDTFAPGGCHGLPKLKNGWLVVHRAPFRGTKTSKKKHQIVDMIFSCEFESIFM